jgi:hypothetical protein
MPRPSAGEGSSEESNDFKNSLANLLAKGNPLAPGVARKQTVVRNKKDEEEENKEKIKLDIFKDEEEGANKYKNAGPVLDNVNDLTLIIFRKSTY